MTEPLTYVSDNGEMVAYYSLDEQQLSSLMMRYGGKEEAIRQMPKVKWQTSDGSTYAELGKVITISGMAMFIPVSLMGGTSLPGTCPLRHLPMDAKALDAKEIDRCIEDIQD